MRRCSRVSRTSSSDNRIVKPREEVTNANRLIIAYDIDTGKYITEYGETGSFQEFIVLLYTTEPSIIVSRSSIEMLLHIEEIFCKDKKWNRCISTVERGQYQPKSAWTGYKLLEKAQYVNWFGWNGGKKEKNKYHFCFDPSSFQTYEWESHEPPFLLKTAIEIRDECVKENKNFRPTQGGIARQFLKDQRFYPEPRRKVPISTNSKVRIATPGGLFQVGKNIYSNYEYSGFLIDQSKAHHYHAIHTTLPNSNSLYAFGRFRADNDKITDTPWRTGERVQSFLQGFSGLIYGKLEYKRRTLQEYRWIPPVLYDTSKPVYWWTSEYSLLESLGAKPVNIIAAWGSYDEDTGLEKFAQYALSIENPKPWQKPLLLSVYGSLSTTAHRFSISFFRSKSGELKTLHHGKHTLSAYVHTANHISEPSTNNVIQFGLIEAATRAESISCANWLQSKNHTILMIYVDGILVMDKGTELPFLPDPWRIKHPLTHLRIVSNNGWTADEDSKLPGGQTAQEARSYRPRMPTPYSHIMWNRDTRRVKRVKAKRVPLRRR